MTGLGTRGVVEGFYGTPWTAAQRHDMIDYLSEIGMNAYLYSPKDDQYTRRNWRDPYPTAEAAELRALAAHARDAGIEFWYGVSPGLSMRYSEPGDLRAVREKLAAALELGATRVALFLDDIPGRLQHPADAEMFSDLVSAQLHLIGFIEQWVSEQPPNVRLAVCPTDYWGHGDEPYISSLGQGLSPATELFWTGRAICAPEITVAEARLFERSTGRRPLYWDNFPVNDVAMTGELHIGPYLGRDAGLADAATGIFSNPMPLAESSKIGLYCIAEFCKDPRGFDAEASWERALLRVAGERDVKDVREFADAVRGSALCVDDAPRLGAHLERFAFDYQFGDAARAVQELRVELAKLAEVGARLEHIENRALAAEIAPWVAQYVRGIRAVDEAVSLLDTDECGVSPQLRGQARVVIMQRLEELRSARLRVFGDLVDMFLSDMVGEFSRD